MFDLIIIGGGPAGVAGAVRASELGLSVALIERVRLGGTCLNRGCIPTKSLLKWAELAEDLKAAGGFGAQIDFRAAEQQVYDKKDSVVEKLGKGVEFLMKKHGVKVYNGAARFLSGDEVAVDCQDGESVLQAKYFLIATGSSPCPLGIEGSEFILSSEKVLEKPLCADSVAIIGGGVIGAEYACYFSASGRKVAVLEAENRLIPAADKDASAYLALLLKKRGVEIITGASVTAVEEEGKKVSFQINGQPRCLAVDAVIAGVGRRATLSGLNLERAGVEYDRLIKVNESFQTTARNIYAAGDVCSKVQLAHLAEAQAVAAVEAIVDAAATMRLDVVPSCIYTAAEIASVGVTEGEGLVSAKVQMGANGKAVLEDKATGFVKTVYERSTRKLTGAVIMCSRASDMISELTLALTQGLTADDIAAVIHPHPSLSESVRASALEAVRLLG